MGEDALDVTTMQGIASRTGGQFFQAMDGQELDGIYSALDELEPGELETISYRPRYELYHWPLGAALLLSLSLQALLALGTLWRPRRARAAT